MSPALAAGFFTTSATWEAQATSLVASNQEPADRGPNSVLWTPKSALRNRGPFQVNVRKRGAALNPLQQTDDHHNSAAPSGGERSPVSEGKTPGGHRNHVCHGDQSQKAKKQWGGFMQNT